MVDEKTVMASGPLNFPAAGPAPQTFGQKLMFMLPGLIIALLLAVGISYWIVSYYNGEMEKNLAAAKAELTEQNKKLGEEIKKVDSENKALQKELADVKDRASKLEEGTKKITSTLSDVAKGLNDLVALDLSSFVKKEKEEQADQNKEISSTKDNVGKIDRRLVYVEQRLEKLKEIEADVNGLKDATGTLKKDYEVLKGDLIAVRKKADVTEQDLVQLDERARLFQLRVLAARAREAAEAARQMDFKTLLQRLDDVEDKK